jgi:hypothetical protein
MGNGTSTSKAAKTNSMNVPAVDGVKPTVDKKPNTAWASQHDVYHKDLTKLSTIHVQSSQSDHELVDAVEEIRPPPQKVSSKNTIVIKGDRNEIEAVLNNVIDKRVMGMYNLPGAVPSLEANKILNGPDRVIRPVPASVPNAVIMAHLRNVKQEKKFEHSPREWKMAFAALASEKCISDGSIVESEVRRLVQTYSVQPDMCNLYIYAVGGGITPCQLAEQMVREQKCTEHVMKEFLGNQVHGYVMKNY